FFQAEDGIRDFHVTGVQTCALPIYPTLEEMNKKHAVLLQEGGKTRVLSWERTELDEDRLVPVLQSFEDFRNRYMHRFVEYPTDRSEERRVGKECSSRWTQHHYRNDR